MSTIYYGTEFKLNVNLDPIGGLTMDEYDFIIDVFCVNSKIISTTKSEAIRVDENNYIVRVDTSTLGQGRIRCKVTANIPDGDFDGGRTEVLYIDTGMDIVKSLR